MPNEGRIDTLAVDAASSVNGAAQKLTERLAHLVDELDSYGGLPNGWNGYRAPAPSAAAIQHAKTLLMEARSAALAVERVEPSAMGGIGVTFATPAREVVVEFYNNGTAHALFSEEASGAMQTQAVALDQKGFKELICNAGTYLHGE